LLGAKAKKERRSDLYTLSRSYFLLPSRALKSNRSCGRCESINMHSSYKIDKNVDVFGVVQNLFNRHYAAGTFSIPKASHLLISAILGIFARNAIGSLCRYSRHLLMAPLHTDTSLAWLYSQRRLATSSAPISSLSH
jgi:hypothetical protein